jgi:hypothetical protein
MNFVTGPIRLPSPNIEGYAISVVTPIPITNLEAATQFGINLVNVVNTKRVCIKLIGGLTFFSSALLVKDLKKVFKESIISNADKKEKLIKEKDSKGRKQRVITKQI